MRNSVIASHSEAIQSVVSGHCEPQQSNPEPHITNELDCRARCCSLAMTTYTVIAMSPPKANDEAIQRPLLSLRGSSQRAEAIQKAANWIAAPLMRLAMTDTISSLRGGISRRSNPESPSLQIVSATWRDAI